MATATARATQRKTAIDRLTKAANALAVSLGIDAPDLPTHHRDAGYLPTLQLDAVASFLESAVPIVNKAETPMKQAMNELDARPKARADESKPKVAAKPKAKAS